MKDGTTKPVTGWPFRLGCTSYVIPADLVPNAEKCAPLFDDIEVVLFESVDFSNIPAVEALHRLAELSREHGNTYTIHFPIDKKAAAPDSNERALFCAQLEKIVHLTASLDPYAYVLHLEGISPETDARTRSRWLLNAAESCAFLAALLGRDAYKVAVENLAYPPEWHAPLVREYGFSDCIDIGHLWRYGADWERECERLLPTARVIHLHGWDGAQDHVSLKKTDPVSLKTLVRRHLRQYEHVLTLELFNETDTFESRELLEALWNA